MTLEGGTSENLLKPSTSLGSQDAPMYAHMLRIARVLLYLICIGVRVPIRAAVLHWHPD